MALAITELRRHRREAGLTQDELARAAGLSSRTVQNIETGAQRSPRPSTLRRIERALVRAALPDEVTRVVPGNGAVRPYADRVPTDQTSQTRDQSRSAVADGALPERYARPAQRLSTAPLRGSGPLFWLELAAPVAVATSSGTFSNARVSVWRAVPFVASPRGANHADRRWRVDELAPGVRPLVGVELVDALRAFRGGST